MSLTRYRLGDLVSKYDKKIENPNLTVNDVSGINSNKEFFEPSKQVGNDTSKYKVVPIGYFATNLMHVGRDIVLPVALNHSHKQKIVSPAYTVFRINTENKILKEYLFMCINSIEKDRYFWFFTDASIRDGLSWNDFCDIEIDLPPLHVQKKYGDIYMSILQNQENYERGLEDLSLALTSTIDQLKKISKKENLRNFLYQSENKNTMDQYSFDSVRGISTEKEFIKSKSNLKNVNLRNYRIVKPGEFGYVTVTSRNGEKISLALNESNNSYLCSATYIIFGIKDREILNPQFLKLLLSREEFDRYARFNSWGSARETFNWDDLCDVVIPVPNIEVQESMANLYKVYRKRKEINEHLKQEIKNICPILVKGAIEEAMREED